MRKVPSSMSWGARSVVSSQAFRQRVPAPAQERRKGVAVTVLTAKACRLGVSFPVCPGVTVPGGSLLVTVTQGSSVMW